MDFVFMLSSAVFTIVGTAGAFKYFGEGDKEYGSIFTFGAVLNVIVFALYANRYLGW